MGNSWFKYVIENKKLWRYGWTLKRLEKVKDFVLNDEDIMYDLLNKHNAKDIEPEFMKLNDNENYLHATGNFICNIHYKMMELNIIKGR